MYLESLGLLLDAVGELMIGITALLVHRRILRDRHLNKKVFKLMHTEELVGWSGVVLVIVGTAVQLAAVL